MIVLGIIAWVLCAEITCGVMIHDQPDEWNDGLEWVMLVCLLGWPILAFISLIYLVMKQLSMIGMFFAGLINKLFEEKEDEE